MEQQGLSRNNSVGVSRRRLLTLAGMAGAGAAVAACAPGTAPGEPASPSTAGGGGWEADWEQTVAAAKREAGLAVVTLAGTGYRNWIDVFRQSFPGIEVDHQQFPSTAFWSPKVLEERAGGLYLWDLVVSGAPTIVGPLKASGALDPLRPLVVQRPDIVDDKNWTDGFEAGWQDIEKKLGYCYSATITGLAVNTDLVREGELNTVDDLLNPKWKGKIFWLDVSGGGTFGPMHVVRVRRGEETVRRLIIDQQPTIGRDARLAAEGLIRGRHAMATGVTESVLQEFRDLGLAKNVKLVDVADFTTLSTSQTWWLLNRAPHPNAAKLFFNWTLTKEGQTAFTQHLKFNSRRTDVPVVNQDGLPKPGRAYITITTEEAIPEVEKTRNYLAELVKG